MEAEALGQFVQFGTAGMVAWMWLSERRAAAVREREIAEAHARLMEQRMHVDALLRVAQETARACAALEAGQRAIGAAVERIADAVCSGRAVAAGGPVARDGGAAHAATLVA